MIGKDQLIEEVENMIGRAVCIGMDLIDHNILLLADLPIRECGMKSDIHQQFGRTTEVRIQNGRIKGGVLFPSEGIELSSDIVQTAQDMIGLPVRCSLEKAMLNEVRETLLLLLFISRSSADDDRQMTNRSSGLLVKDAQSVREARPMKSLLDDLHVSVFF